MDIAHHILGESAVAALIGGVFPLTKKKNNPTPRGSLAPHVPPEFFFTFSPFFWRTASLPCGPLFCLACPSIGQEIMDSLEFWQIQANRVGINTTAKTYCANVTFVNIGASPNSATTGFLRTTVREWATKTNPIAHFFVGPFGSALSLPVMQELDANGKIALMPASASPDLYECSTTALSAQPECATKSATAKRFDKAFGMQPPASRSSLPFLSIAQLSGAKTVGFYVENSTFSKSLVAGARNELATYGMTEVVTAAVSSAPTNEEWIGAMTQLREADPEIIIGGTTGSVSCKGLLAQFSIQGWLPKAALFSLCASDPSAKTNFPNSKYFVDYMEWDRRLTGSEYADHLYFPATVNYTSPMLMARAFTSRFTKYGGDVEDTPPVFGVTFAAGVVVRRKERRREEKKILLNLFFF